MTFISDLAFKLNCIKVKVVPNSASIISDHIMRESLITRDYFFLVNTKSGSHQGKRIVELTS